MNNMIEKSIQIFLIVIYFSPSQSVSTQDNLQKDNARYIHPMIGAVT